RLIVNSAFCMIDKKSKDPKFVFLNLANAIKANGFKDMDIIIWAKGDEDFIKNHNYSNRWGSWMSASRPVIRSDSEIIMIFAKNSIKKLRKGESTITKEDFKKYTKNIWYIRNYSNPVHPATYPVKLVVNLINLYTYKDDVILDPFVGIGTTLMGCIETGRKCIGIELCEDYYKEAIKNVSNFNVDLFNQNSTIR
ncbi:MAG: site-specific DNA-methyltransferase, partial [Candidatus Methanomethylicia archaeon]